MKTAEQETPPQCTEVDLRYWIEAWRAGDERAGCRLYNLLASDITRFIRSRARNADLVEDLVHETFIAVRSTRGRIKGNPRAYVFGVAYNKLRHHNRSCARKSASHRSFANEQEIPEGNVEGMLDTKRERRLLMKSLRRLSFDDQVMIYLRHIQGLSGRELAGAFSVTERCVNGRLARARGRLLDKLMELAPSYGLFESTSRSASGWLDALADHREQMQKCLKSHKRPRALATVRSCERSLTKKLVP